MMYMCIIHTVYIRNYILHTVYITCVHVYIYACPMYTCNIYCIYSTYTVYMYMHICTLYMYIYNIYFLIYILYKNILISYLSFIVEHWRDFSFWKM